MRRTPRFSLLAALAAVLVVPAPGAALGRQSVFGSAGELFTVRSGQYASLFPRGTDPVMPGSPVLALDIAGPGAAAQRLLVPGTDGSETEEAASIVFEDAGRSVYVLWQSRGLAGRAELDLVRWNAASGWGEVIEVSGDPLTLKGTPQLAVSRRQARRRDGAARPLTVLHLVWSEAQNPDGHVLWAPLVLEDGEYLGWNPVVALDDLLDGAPTAAAGAVDAVVVDSGREPSGAVAAFAAAGRLTTVEMRALPSELSRLVDDIAARVAASAGVPLQQLAGDLRAHLVGGGDLVHPALATHLAELAHARVLAAAGTRLANDRAALAADLRAHLVGGGAGALFGIDAGQRTPPRVEVVELAASVASALPTHLVAVRRVTSRPLPALGPGPHDLFVSPDGERAIVRWFENGAVRYRETTPNGWTTVIAPEVPRGVDVDELLRARLRD